MFSEDNTYDSLLIERCRNGDEEAASELYNKYYKLGFDAAYRSGAHIDEAEDIVQEAFMRVFEALKQGKGPELLFGKYLSVVVRNICNSPKGKLEVVAKEHEDLLKIIDNKPQEQLVKGSGVIDAFLKLPEKYKQVIWLRVIEGMNGNDIAQELKITGSALSQLYKRAKANLQSNYLSILAAGEHPEECKEFGSLMGDYVLGRAKIVAKRKVNSHLEICEHCPKVFDRLKGTSSRFLLIIPAFFVNILSDIKHRFLVNALCFEGNVKSTFFQSLIQHKFSYSILFASVSLCSLETVHTQVNTSEVYKNNFSSSINTDLPVSEINQYPDLGDSRYFDTLLGRSITDGYVSPVRIMKNDCSVRFHDDDFSKPIFVINNQDNDYCFVSVYLNGEIIQENIRVHSKLYFHPFYSGTYTFLLNNAGEYSDNQYKFE